MAEIYDIPDVEHLLPDVEHLRLQGKNIKLHAVATGPQDGPLVVLLHGFPEFWYSWRRQIGPLADDVLALTSDLGRDCFAVVGHDWGAGVAWHLAARNPKRVTQAAVLNGPNVATVRNYLSTHPSQVLKSSYAGFFQLPWLPEWSLRAANFKLLRTALTWTSRPGTFFPNAEAFRPYHDAWARPGALTAMLNWYRALLKHYVRPCERVSVPVRVVWGKRDKFLNCSIAEAGQAQCNDRSTPFYLPNATHWVQHEEPVSVNRLLIEFLCGPSPRQG